MDDKKLICERLKNTKENKPSYSGIIFRSVIARDTNNLAYFGGVIYPRAYNARLTIDDIIRAVDGYDIDTDEAIILLQYRKCKGMIIKCCSNDTDKDVYLIGELEPNNDSFDLML